MIYIFDENECIEISKGYNTSEQIQRAKNKLNEYLQSNYITLTNSNQLKHMIHYSSTPC